MKFANNRKIFGASKPARREGSTIKRPFNFDDHRNKDRRYRYKIYSLILMAFCVTGTLYHYHQEAAFADRGQMVMGKIIKSDPKFGPINNYECANNHRECSYEIIVEFKAQNGSVYYAKETTFKHQLYHLYKDSQATIWYLTDDPQDNFVLPQNAKPPSWAIAKFLNVLGIIIFGIIAVWIQFLSQDSDFKKSWLGRNRFEMD